MDVTEKQTVTESQTGQRGSLLRQESVDGRLGAVIERMRERFAFTTALETDALCTISKEFYGGGCKSKSTSNFKAEGAATPPHARLP